MHIVNTLVPVFLIIAIGVALRRSNFLTSELVSGISKLTYWVALPCLLFYEVANAQYDFGMASKTFLVVVSGMAGCIVISFVTALLLRMPVSSIGTFVQGCYRGNLAYIGLPVLIYSFSNTDQADADRFRTIAVLVLALMVPIYNILAVIFLLASQHRLDRHVSIKIFRQTITNPLFLSCIFGVVYSLFFKGLAFPIDRTFKAISAMALPLSLLTIGASLSEEKVGGYLKVSILASIIKLAVGPVIGLIMLKLLSLGAGQARVAMIFLACPTAVASYIMTDQLGGDRGLSAKIVVLTSILSVISLGLVVAFF